VRLVGRTRIGRRGRGSVLRLRSLPLGAAGGLLNVIPSLGVLIELGSPTLRQRRTIGRRLVAGLRRRSTVWLLRSGRAVLLRSGRTVTLRRGRTTVALRGRSSVLLLGRRRCVTLGRRSTVALRSRRAVALRGSSVSVIAVGTGV